MVVTTQDVPHALHSRESMSTNSTSPFFVAEVTRKSRRARRRNDASHSWGHAEQTLMISGCPGRGETLCRSPSWMTVETSPRCSTVWAVIFSKRLSSFANTGMDGSGSHYKCCVIARSMMGSSSPRPPASIRIINRQQWNLGVECGWLADAKITN